MPREGFRHPRAARAARVAVLALLGSVTPALAQEPGAAGTPTPGAGFEPEFIDPAEYRGEQILLYDWPALTALVRWSGPVAEAIAREEGTLDADLLEELRDRVGALAESDPPDFLAARRDSVDAILGRVQSRLDAADEMLAESLPAEIADPTGEERPNVSDRDRTYATGPTAVRVPAGIDVGEADSLPGASIEGSAGLTYVDLVTEALVELDGLVHLVRRLGQPATESPAGSAPSSRPDRAPPRRAP
jgi:hypothetical protein